MIDKVIGHRKQLAYFENLIENKSYLHAYLFEGEDGIGKKLSAKQIARTILCRDDIDRRQFDAGNFNDILIVTAEGDEIKTSEVKNIHDYLLSQPVKADKKIVIIDECEKMNVHAQNKILKILEEPPAYALFFLITSSRDSLLDTVLSRLIRIPFNALSVEEIRQYTEVNNVVFDESAALASLGSISKYLALLGSQDEGVYDFATKLIKALKSNNKVEIFNTVKEAEKYKDKLSELLDALEFLSDKVLLTSDNARLEAAKLSTYMRIVAETRLRFLRNVQKDLLISNLVLKMQGVFR